MKTFQAKNKTVIRNWHLLNLDGIVLGRAATQIANILRGKNKPQFTPHVDTGDFVVALNADKIKFTGKKLEDKIYYSHSGYPGGLTEQTAMLLMKKNPEKLIKKAVQGMLPKSILGRGLLSKLKIYRGSEHPHEAQKPVELKPG